MKFEFYQLKTVKFGRCDRTKHSTIMKYFDLIGDPLLHITSHPAAATEEYKLTSNKNIRFFLCPHPVMGMTNANMIALAGLI